MCGQFEIITTIDELAAQFGAVADEALTGFSPGKRIVPYSLAPVLVEDGGKRKLRAMRFSLLPAWAKEPKLKFSTFNARLDSVDSKPTWKRPFIARHCIVPITSFFEAIYEGDHAGTMVRLTPAQSGKPLLAAAIFDRWSPSIGDGLIESFAIITDEPSPFIRAIGHDRQPLFLNEEGANAWLAGTWGGDPKSLKLALQGARVWPELSVAKDRDMKVGWEKRRKSSSS